MSFDRQAFWRWCRRYRYRIAGGVLSVLGLAFAALIAFLASAKTPPSASESGFTVLLSAVFQGASVYLFAKGAPNPQALGIQMRRHARLGETLTGVRKLAEDAANSDDPAIAQKAVDRLSWQLQEAEQDHDDLASDWYRLYEDLADAPEDGTTE
ncbi:MULTISPECIES: hypothetical protein [unclassified Curtobacterium]|uniref:hypothetical protein n=1 Tax=unclassified Curtobacterium TaxID=257496 RepID=UPI000DA9DFE7|nr:MULTISPECIES: hypothetical protein [unclassified Curtobacterium]PZE25979.1 hypothetical protein DEI86_09040 [Curtobacterium sp. MCBD17_028]PZF61972.1 hypothetical protein DEI92_00080 [Curtobacterium sp. MCBD17_034]PZM34094.1 hypothetical protein DEI90_10620 [Curtobacterium sp. MCBD17_031]